MSLTLNSPALDKPMVGMGQVFVASAPQVIGAVLGSCIGVSLYHARRQIAAFAHVVLPNSSGKGGTPGKFADTAIPELLRLLALEGAETAGLVAKLAGGSNMFGSVAQQLQIGEQNAAACRQALQHHRIPLLAEHLGGKQGRRISFCCTTGEYTIEMVGKPSAII
jgi:chemotaxis protein CheD